MLGDLAGWRTFVGRCALATPPLRPLSALPSTSPSPVPAVLCGYGWQPSPAPLFLAQDRFLTWRSKSSDSFESIPYPSTVTSIALPGSSRQSFVQYGSLNTCIRPREFSVQQCEKDQGFAGFAIYQSRTADGDLSWTQVAEHNHRRLIHGEFTLIALKDLGTYIKPEVLSACLSSTNALSSGLAAPGDKLVVQVQSSRAVRVSARSSPPRLGACAGAFIPKGNRGNIGGREQLARHR